MIRNDIIATLRAHESELKASGVASLSVIGSAARGGQRGDSDIDVVVRLSEDSRIEGFGYFGRLATIGRRLEAILGTQVDVVAEPIQKERLRERIQKERLLAF